MFVNPTAVLDAVGTSAGMSVGDFGTGEGAYARELSRRVGESGVVYAFDVQKDLVSRLVTHVRELGLGNVRAVWTDLEEIGSTKLPDASLDLAVVANVLFLVENKQAFIAEIKRVLRPNGRLLIVDWSESFGHLGPHPDHVVTKGSARALAEGAGFAFDREIDGGAHHYGLVFRATR